MKMLPLLYEFYNLDEMETNNYYIVIEAWENG
jgi:hypothetical protein